MAPFRGSRYLRCFYCGRASNKKNDRATRQFLCPHCDATNYLDEVCILSRRAQATRNCANMHIEWRHHGPSGRNDSLEPRAHPICLPTISRVGLPRGPDSLRRHLLRHLPEEPAVLHLPTSGVPPRRPRRPSLPRARAQILQVPRGAGRALPPDLRRLRAARPREAQQRGLRREDGLPAAQPGEE